MVQPDFTDIALFEIGKEKSMYTGLTPIVSDWSEKTSWMPQWSVPMLQLTDLYL